MYNHLYNLPLLSSLQIFQMFSIPIRINIKIHYLCTKYIYQISVPNNYLTIDPV